jgi:hypothetical protein
VAGGDRFYYPLPGVLRGRPMRVHRSSFCLCGSSNVWRPGAIWKVDLRRLWWTASAGGFTGEGCALEWWKDLYVISLFSECLLANGWRCIYNFIVPSF